MTSLAIALSCRRTLLRVGALPTAFEQTKPNLATTLSPWGAWTSEPPVS